MTPPFRSFAAPMTVLELPVHGLTLRRAVPHHLAPSTSSQFDVDSGEAGGRFHTGGTCMNVDVRFRL